jgi:hypothetical protein
MAKADRLARLDERRIELEAEYRSVLIAALERTAGGVWGLFDHQQDRHARAKAAPDVEALGDLAEAIGDARERLSLEPFALHDEFLKARGKPRSPSAVGEPKQARAWLERLANAG